MPKFGPGLKLPSPRIAKLVAVPEMTKLPAVSFALTDGEADEVLRRVAPVLIWKPVADSVRNEPRLSVSLSA